MSNKEEALTIPEWYRALDAYTFDTRFVKLSPEAVAALAAGADGGKKVDMDSELSKTVIAELRKVMAELPGNCFVSVDSCAPTDTERFKHKGGAVYSAKSAWYYLVQSEKVAQAAAAGKVKFICVRPYRHISKAREFRLFIRGGKLCAMSQYNLIRHFRRLDGVQKKYWRLAEELVSRISWRLPAPDVVMDIYITSRQEIIIIDFNCWGEPTDPLLLSWDADWDNVAGMHIIPAPTKISGSVKVSF
ncbi:MAG: hypothetical protein IKC89_01160 [Lentisphaeria bacterium]|nr:hypothetical protein [Lentisphaeria bacterium]